MSKLTTTLIVLVLAPLSVGAAVNTKKIVYKHGDVECHGYLAWDNDIKGPRPGVLVIHEW